MKNTAHASALDSCNNCDGINLELDELGYCSECRKEVDENTATAQYKNLCEIVAMFCKAKGLDETSREQIASLIALAMRIGKDYSPAS